MWSVNLSALVLVLLLMPIEAKRNIIMMVTDGTGPSSINLARYYNQYVNNNDTELLTLDSYLVGTSRTRSSSSLITDSAAGATAFSCALKSYNGAIGVDQHQQSCYTVLEALKHKGYKTGLVVTTSLTDATPAAFNAHVDYRSMQDEIAMQQLGINSAFGPVTDLMVGGGRCFYLPGSHPDGCRSDNVNLIEYAQNQGWNVATNRTAFDAWDLGHNVQLPLLAVHAFYNVPYEIDRNETEHPSLYEQTVLALNVLSNATADSEEGFFLMIEGSRIDHAGHHNDAHAQVREVLAYDKAFEAVIDFIDHSDVDTVMVATSDHETGGLTVGRQVGKDYPEYVWYPEVLHDATASGERINHELNHFVNESPSTDELREYLAETVFGTQLGIDSFEASELDEAIDLIAQGDIPQAVEYFKNMVCERALVGFTTHGHTAVDVNIYAHANTKDGKDLIQGHIAGARENTEVGSLLALLGDVNRVGSKIDYKFSPPRPAFNIDYFEEDDVAEIEMEVELTEEKEHGFVDHLRNEPLEKEDSHEMGYSESLEREL